jgi:hypothetical protein
MLAAGEYKEGSIHYVINNDKMKGPSCHYTAFCHKKIDQTDPEG